MIFVRTYILFVQVRVAQKQLSDCLGMTELRGQHHWRRAGGPGTRVHGGAVVDQPRGELFMAGAGHHMQSLLVAHPLLKTDAVFY